MIIATMIKEIQMIEIVFFTESDGGLEEVLMVVDN